MRSSIAALVCAWVLLVSTIAAGAPGTPTQRAEAAMKEAAALEKGGRNDEALAKYEEAYAIAPTGTAAHQLARVEATLGRHVLAIQHHREALRDVKLPTELRRVSEVAVEDLKTKIGILLLDVPEAATTTVDAKEVEPKQPAEVTPGPHVVKIRLGGETKSSDVVATAGQVTQVKLRFGPDAPVEPGPSSTPPPITPPATTETKWPLPKIVTVGAGAAVAAGLLATSAIIFATADDVRASSPIQCADSRAAGCASLAESRSTYDGSRTSVAVLFYSGVVVGVLTGAAALLWPNELTTKKLGGSGSLARHAFTFTF